MFSIFYCFFFFICKTYSEGDRDRDEGRGRKVTTLCQIFFIKAEDEEMKQKDIMAEISTTLLSKVQIQLHLGPTEQFFFSFLFLQLSW